MIKKSYFLIGILTAIICTLGITITVASIYGVGVGDKVIVSKSQYQKMSQANDESEKINSLKAFIKTNYYKSTDKVDFETGEIKGLFEALNDPYSVYMTAKEYKAFNEESNGEYAGVGIVVEPGKDGLLTVVSPITGSPAFKAGIKSGDVIYRVDKKDVSSKDYEKAISMIKGKPGTTVELTIYRKSSKEPLIFKIKREIIKINAVETKRLDNSISYVKINSFDDDVAAEFNKAIESSKGMKGLVIDLRGNPGGSLEQCVEVADRILEKGMIVFTKDRSGKKDEYLASPKEYLNVPIAILVDGGSASASEVLTGALRDNKKAVVIGTKTFGKGIVQTLFPVPDGGAIKLTTSEYFKPDGTNIHGIGIQPDIKIIDDSKTKADEVLDKAIKEIGKK